MDFGRWVLCERTSSLMQMQMSTLTRIHPSLGLSLSSTSSYVVVAMITSERIAETLTRLWTSSTAHLRQIYNTIQPSKHLNYQILRFAFLSNIFYLANLIYTYFFFYNNQKCIQMFTLC